jgi:hypothetical protein
MNLIMQLNMLGRKVNRHYPDINEGGCCVYAVTVARELSKLGMRPKIVVAGGSGDLNVETIRKDIKDPGDHRAWNSKKIWFNHMGVAFTYKRTKYHYDSHGCEKAGEEFQGFKVYPGRMRVSDARKLAMNPSGWNSNFDRDLIPEIEAMVEKWFLPKSKLVRAIESVTSRRK